MAADADRLLLVGLSHRTAPVEVRERLAFDADRVRVELDRLREQGICDEALLLSTCNRVELYAVPKDGEADRVRAWIGSFRAPGGQDLERHLYWLSGREVVRHLFRVAASLDSLVVGEPQILGQVKEAVRTAEQTHALGRMLHPLASRTLAVAKRVRNETDIGRFRVGIGNAGVDLANQIFGDLAGHRAMLIGVGEMGRQVARALLNAGLDELIVANRTYERAVEVAEANGGTPITMERVPEYLSRVDIVITAAGGSKPILGRSQVKRALKERRYKPLFLIDLAVPRNVDPRIDDIEEAYLFNVDDLTQVVEQGRAAREEAAREANRLVDEETDRFLRTLAEVSVGEDIGRITRKMESIRAVELARSKRLLDSLDEDQRAQLEAMSRALVKKMLHGPLLAIRRAARDGDTEAVRRIVDIYEEDE